MTQGAQPQFHRSTETMQQSISQRTAGGGADFLLPYLKPGMSLLDCGCGPGTITAGLAEVVAPGNVVGIDLDESQLAKARALVSEQKIENLSFQDADVYKLPLPDASFDVAFASNVMMHLGDPLSALREIRRVLKPSGFIGLHDRAQEFVIREPSNALLEAWRELHPRAAAQNGGTPTFGPRQRAFLRQAGFSRTQGLSVARAVGTQEDAQAFARTEMAQLHDVAGPTAIREGWMKQDDVDAMAEALTAWGEDPDAYAVVIICRAIGWV